MNHDRVLMRIGVVHAALVAVLALAWAANAKRAGGVLLGGSAMALSFGLLWATAAFFADRGRTLLLATLATVKVLLYGALITAAFAGFFVPDGIGFCAGVTSFFVATLAVSCGAALGKA